MRKTTSQMIDKSIMEGYELLESGKGNYDESVSNYRAQGYDVRAWYLLKSKGDRDWVLYGKKRVRSARTKKVEKVDYSKLTVKELRKLCSQKKISGYSKMSKSEIISRLDQVC